MTASSGPTPKLRAIDLQYHDVRRDKGLYYRLEASGKVERLTTDDEVEAAIDGAARGHARLLPRPVHRASIPTRSRPPRGTRLIVDTGADALQRIPMREPLRGTKEHVEELLDAGAKTPPRSSRRLQA